MVRTCAAVLSMACVGIAWLVSAAPAQAAPGECWFDTVPTETYFECVAWWEFGPGPNQLINVFEGSTSQGTYNPLDSSDGDPGGADAMSGFDLMSLGLTARQISAARDNPVEWRFLQLFVQGRISSDNDTVTTSTGTIACAKHLSEYTVPHTKKTAVAAVIISCSEPVQVGDSFEWLSTDTGIQFDGSVDPSDPNPRFFYAAASSTTGGRRGHRYAVYCPTYAVPGGNTQAGSCLVGAVVNIGHQIRGV